MQHFKNKFSDNSYQDTFSNIQQCLRLNDLDEISDGTHFLLFEMIGLFSFKQWTLEQSILFMLEFLKRLDLKPDYVTIHPDKLSEWRGYYDKLNLPIKEDTECQWSDGDIGGYCTEFYINDVEIGNIVNTLGHSIDIGFGLERLLFVSNSLKTKTKLEILEETSLQLIKEGVKIGHYRQEYVLKKLLNESVFMGSQRTEKEFVDVKKRLIGVYQRYLKSRTQPQLMGKTDDYWYNTLGFDIKRIQEYQKLLEPTQH